MIKISAVLIILGLTVVSPLYSQSKPPMVYLDKGACPFECCTYRDWITHKSTVAYARPDKRSKRVGTFKAGSNVVGLTGEVRSVGTRFVITKRHGKYKPRDVLWVYTSRGEGFYLVWFKGRMYDEGLDYVSGPFEESIPKCEDTPSCWGKLEKELQMVWWVKVKSADGWVGWTDQPGNFGNQDACG